MQKPAEGSYNELLQPVVLLGQHFWHVEHG